eukprot:INCI9526.2.p2 GENE.INCI9526.2~~INCI9526.2.p2  ORF type:complete len:184 (+),score=56.70 INCI9526.2:184-735(+)
MVFYFTASTGHVMYMGKDKFENEDLIKYCWAEDIWFHVDDLSSAHVYLRYPAPGTKHKPVDINEVPPELVAECSQLVKANSIEGCKKASVRIVYTPGSNLRKTADMKTGQVGFKDKKLVIRTTIEKEKTIVKAIEKTREEMHPDLFKEKQRRDAEVVAARKRRQAAEAKAKRKAEAEFAQKKT